MSQRGYSETDWPDFVPLPSYLPMDEAKRRARKAFLRAAVIFGALGFAAGAAFGETISIGSMYINGYEPKGTTVSISPSDLPGEWARVVMENRHVNQGSDTGDYSLTFDGVVIPLEFVWDQDPILGSDAITLTPPDGIICVPADCSVTVPEGMTGEIVLLDWRGM
jgi:hypothetical protein